MEQQRTNPAPTWNALDHMTAEEFDKIRAEHVGLLTLREVTKLIGRSTAAVYDDMKKGEFPRAIKTGARSVRWKSSEVFAWIESAARVDC